MQLDRLNGLVLNKALNVLYCKSRNDMKAVETMEIKAFIVSKSTYLLFKWPQIILQLKFSKLRPNFPNYVVSSPELDSTVSTPKSLR